MKKEESDWILKLDIVEKGDKLQVGYNISAVAEKAVLTC